MTSDSALSSRRRPLPISPLLPIVTLSLLFLLHLSSLPPLAGAAEPGSCGDGLDCSVYEDLGMHVDMGSSSERVGPPDNAWSDMKHTGQVGHLPVCPCPSLLSLLFILLFLSPLSMHRLSSTHPPALSPPPPPPPSSPPSPLSQTASSSCPPPGTHQRLVSEQCKVPPSRTHVSFHPPSTSIFPPPSPPCNMPQQQTQQPQR